MDSLEIRLNMMNFQGAALDWTSKGTFHGQNIKESACFFFFSSCPLLLLIFGIFSKDKFPIQLNRFVVILNSIA